VGKVGEIGGGGVVVAIWFLWLRAHGFGRSSTGGHGGLGLLITNWKKEGK